MYVLINLLCTVALEGGDIIDEQSIEQISGVLSPFVLSTQSRIPRVMEIALDAINFMIGIFFCFS